MPSKRNTRSRKNRKTGAGYLSPAEFFNPEARQPSAGPHDLPITSEPTAGWVRPPMTATTMMSPNVKQTGGNTRRNRKNRKNGGFAPGIMGGFVSNVQAAVVPLVLAGLYSVFGVKSANKTARAVSTVSSKKGGASRKNRKNRRFANME